MTAGVEWAARWAQRRGERRLAARTVLDELERALLLLRAARGVGNLKGLPKVAPLAAAWREGRGFLTSLNWTAWSQVYGGVLMLEQLGDSPERWATAENLDGLDNALVEAMNALLPYVARGGGESRVTLPAGYQGGTELSESAVPESVQQEP